MSHDGTERRRASWGRSFRASIAPTGGLFPGFDPRRTGNDASVAQRQCPGRQFKMRDRMAKRTKSIP